jgi:C1A family cysteine protease
MKSFKKYIMLISIFLLPGFAALSQEKDLLKFQTGDSIETLRDKITHNGYEFTVENNWVFDMPAEQKAEFFSRKAPATKKLSLKDEDIGPLSDGIGDTLPANFDWRNFNGHSYIGSVRDQGYCGSCYAFGAAAAAEGTWNYAKGLYDGNSSDFSEAFIAFCLSDHYDGFDGCEGAYYDYEELDGLIDYGIPNESAFPYTDIEQSCKASSWDAPRVPFQSWHRIPCGDIDAIKTAIMTYGVVDAAVLVGTAFEAYDSGIYSDSNTSCNDTPCYYAETNHAIALVGWDDNGNAVTNGYWILRNSWGKSWGESGYMKIKYKSANVSCAACYLVPYSGATPTPTPTPTSGPTPAVPNPGDLLINEIDYDDTETDDESFIELKNASSFSIDLSTIEIVFLNNSTTNEYGVYQPSKKILLPGQYRVFGTSVDSSGISANVDETMSVTSIQNGANDGVYLRLAENKTTIIDSVCYEGDVAHPDGSPDSGNAGTDSNLDSGKSLSRYPDGTDSNNNALDFTFQISTPGESNGGGTPTPSPTPSPTPTSTPTPTDTPTTPTMPLARPVLHVEIYEISVVNTGAVKYTYEWTSTNGEKVVHADRTEIEDEIRDNGSDITFNMGEIWTVKVTPYNDQGDPGPSYESKFIFEQDGSMKFTGWILR